jgi:hypothetical protein
MAKLTLDVNSLAVQSFQTTAPGASAAGTVFGRAEAVPDDTYRCSNSPDCLVTDKPSCNGTCDGDSCYESCYGSCGSCIASCPYTACYTCPASCGATCPYCAEPTLPTET